MPDDYPIAALVLAAISALIFALAIVWMIR